MDVLSRWGIASRRSLCTYSGAKAQGSRGGAQSVVAWHCTSVAARKLGWGNFLARSKLTLKKLSCIHCSACLSLFYTLLAWVQMFLCMDMSKKCWDEVGLILHWTWRCSMISSTYFKFMLGPCSLRPILRDTTILAIFFGWSCFLISIHIRVLLLSISTI